MTRLATVSGSLTLEDLHTTFQLSCLGSSPMNQSYANQCQGCVECSTTPGEIVCSSLRLYDVKLYEATTVRLHLTGMPQADDSKQVRHHLVRHSFAVLGPVLAVLGLAPHIVSEGSVCQQQRQEDDVEVGHVGGGQGWYCPAEGPNNFR